MGGFIYNCVARGIAVHLKGFSLDDELEEERIKTSHSKSR